MRRHRLIIAGKKGFPLEFWSMHFAPIHRIAALCVLIGTALVPGLAAQTQIGFLQLPVRRDLVFDHAGRYLYITTTDGWIRRYNISTGALESGYNVGGSLNGADIAADDSFLLVCQGNTVGSQGTIHRVDLESGGVTNINYPLVFLEYGGWDVVIASNGLALFTAIGPTPLRQIDLATNAVTERPDAPSSVPNLLSGPAQIYRSADRTRVYILETNSSAGPAFTYSAVTNSFGPSVNAGMYFSEASAAVNRNGTLLGSLVEIQSSLYTSLPHVALDTAPDLRFVRGFNEGDSGIAFDAVTDTLYAASSLSGEIIAYDTGTFAKKYRFSAGETISKGVRLLGRGNLVASQDGRYLALATEFGFRVYALPTVPPAPLPLPTPTLSTRRDMIFDHSGQFLYLTTSTGLVERYHLSTGDLSVIADLGGSLNGADIAMDDSFLLVAQNRIGVKEGALQKVNLVTGQVTNINYTRVYPEAGAFDIAIGSNGRALVTTRVFDGFSAWTPVRQVDLANNAITIRTDVPGSAGPNPSVPYRTVRLDTQIYRNATGTRFYFLESDTSGGPIFTYDAVSNTFGPSGETQTFLDFASGAVSRDGSLLATRQGYPNHASLETAPGFNLIQTFDFDGGVAFDAVTDVFYGVDSVVDQIIAYDTNTLAEKYHLNIGENMSPHSNPFATGTLVASNDGRYLALATASGLRLFTLPLPIPPPSPVLPPIFGAPRDMVFDHAGHYLYITTATGFVWPYNLLTSQLDTPYKLGGYLNGIDISPDDSYVLVAQNDQGLTQGRFQKLALGGGAITNINYLRTSTEDGGWDVAIASNGLALVATRGFGPIRQIDLATNAISIRSESQVGYGLFGPVSIERSADGNRICIFEYQLSSLSVFPYSATSNTFGPKGSGLASVTSAVNRDGSLLGGSLYNRDASLTTLPGFGFVHTFSGLRHAVTFDAGQDILYAVNPATDEIIGYDTGTFVERIRVAIGEDISSSSVATQFEYTFVASPDGRYLALMAPSAIRIYDLLTGAASAISTLPYLGNISTRAVVGVGDNVPIGGFIITGTDSKKVVIRAIGPSLAAFGIANALQDPILELHDSTGATIAFNDNWTESQEAQIRATGLSPSDNREAALAATLAPGSYTAIMRGKNDTVGVGVIELYDIDPNAKSRLANISTRGSVETGNNVMIAGLIIGGESASFEVHKRKVLVRGLGPSLTQANVPNALQDPTLDLYNSNGMILMSNDNWKQWQQTEIQATGLAPTNDRECAIILSLGPESYTAILRGKGGTTGVGLVEVYSLP